MRPVLLIATTNPGKVQEIRAVLGELQADLRGLQDYPHLPPAIEDEPTFMANAQKKALHYARLTGELTLADDSGLEVECLGGEPGVHSARFAGPQRNDLANNAKLIELLRDVPQQRRRACYRCAIAVASRASVLATSEGRLDGQIVDRPRGANGFGYDPHFLIPELDRTAAELEPPDKNRISHRGLALRAVCSQLTEVLRSLS